MLDRATTLTALARIGLCMTIIGIAVACGPAPKGSDPDQVAIYAAVIRRIYVRDDTFGGQLQPPSVYVVRPTDDSIGDPGVPQGASQEISADVQRNIVAALADLPASLTWVDSRDDVKLDPSTSAVADGGVIITLGNIHLQDDGSAQVSASIYIANLAAGGQTYILQQVDGEWSVTGNTGVEWMS